MPKDLVSDLDAEGQQGTHLLHVTGGEAVPPSSAADDHRRAIRQVEASVARLHEEVAALRRGGAQ